MLAFDGDLPGDLDAAATSSAADGVIRARMRAPEGTGDTKRTRFAP